MSEVLVRDVSDDAHALFVRVSELIGQTRAAVASHASQEGEEASNGPILCTETSREQVELLEMHRDGIVVAEYWTAPPPRPTSRPV